MHPSTEYRASNVTLFIRQLTKRRLHFCSVVPVASAIHLPLMVSPPARTPPLCQKEVPCSPFRLTSHCMTMQHHQLDQAGPSLAPVSGSDSDELEGFAEDLGSDTDSDNDSSRWYREDSLVLVQARKALDHQFTNNRIPKSDCWDEVSIRLLYLGYNRTWEMCRNRYQYLIKRHKKANPNCDWSRDNIFDELEKTCFLLPSRPEPAPVQPILPPQVAPTAQAQQLPHSSKELEAGGSSSSRWPKTQVHLLIQLCVQRRKELQEALAGPKDMPWGEISASMRNLGFARNSSECRKKWQKINRRYQRKKKRDRPSGWHYFHIMEAIELLDSRAAASTSKRATFDLNRTPSP
ncbi:hypothetical protein ACP70R_006048 [Stipagrostis hirtigluma subsp. patula]